MSADRLCKLLTQFSRINKRYRLFVPGPGYDARTVSVDETLELVGEVPEGLSDVELLQLCADVAEVGFGITYRHYWPEAFVQPQHVPELIELGTSAFLKKFPEYVTWKRVSKRKLVKA